VIALVLSLVFGVILQDSGQAVNARSVCLSIPEARSAVAKLEDRLLLIEKDSLCSERHQQDSLALVASDTAYSKIKQAQGLEHKNFLEADSARKHCVAVAEKVRSSSYWKGFWHGAGALGAAGLVTSVVVFFYGVHVGSN